MITLNILKLSARLTWRRRFGAMLTCIGVASGAFLMTVIETMQGTLTEATSLKPEDRKLVVYRENRFCPFASRLPDAYTARIARVEGVAQVIPVRVIVNNCGTSLGVITFRGLPAEALPGLKLKLIEGSLEAFGQRGDSAVVGQRLAQRYGLKVGQSLDAAGIRVSVAAIVSADEAKNEDVAYVKLDFLQQSTRSLGIVTQFDVLVKEGFDLKVVAQAIDTELHGGQEPTQTRPEKVFVAQMARRLVELIEFTRWVGLAAVAAVLAIVANALMIEVRGRVKLNAVLMTLGYQPGHIRLIVLAEGLALGLFGGLFGLIAAWLFLHFGRFSLSTDGVTLAFQTSPQRLFLVCGICSLLGLLAAVFPAMVAARQSIVASLSAER